MLFEDETKNAMIESLELFHQITHLRHFLRSEMILFLNKMDLFEEKLKEGELLGQCFDSNKNSMYTGIIQWDDTNDDINYNPNNNLNENDNINYYEQCKARALKFIQDRYKEVAKDGKTIYTHYTTATDQSIVKKVFWDVQHILIQDHLNKAALLPGMV